MRPITAADEAAFIAAARVSRQLHRPWVQPPCDTEGFARHLARFDGEAHHGFVLEVKGELAGAINLTNIVMGAFRSGYLGYYAFAGFAGRGLMTAGLNAVVQHAFQGLGLHRVEANIQPGNAASIALVRRCGFQLEGYSPRYLKIGGRWRDHERWARLKR
ncbi:GNAT family protein [Roseateles sp.]|uniref:GNAT family N-acetyltransferase n=1 Tax=Roseateles sp. TaxID=1971397 RepID=UPI0025D641E1|nr:GNAT family protein [Roseateles sp.]MBV8036068.1 GNAT family N-acetyltransferase [Roseateles sp.]